MPATNGEAGKVKECMTDLALRHARQLQLPQVQTVHATAAVRRSVRSRSSYPDVRWTAQHASNRQHGSGCDRRPIIVTMRTGAA
jgi:hypothetical protein